MNIFLVTTSYDRVLTVRADSRADAEAKALKGLAVGELILVVQLI